MKFNCVAALTLCAAVSWHANAQGIVNKLKQKAAQVTEQAIEKKINPNSGNQQGNSGNQPGNQSGNPANTSGAGLVITPPDVRQNLAEAEASFKSGNYSDARYAIRQAMLGVEMEIGQKVLTSLPESVVGLKKEAESDKVTSMGYGWVGLTIHREYSSGNKQLSVDIANNSAWMSAVNAYLASGGYAQQSTGGQQNWKQTKVKGYRGIIEYNEGSGYKLSVPIGQSSLIVWQGINFATEQEVMNAANAFDIDGIKNKLGEK
jgi:hypothetical protein